MCPWSSHIRPPQAEAEGEAEGEGEGEGEAEGETANGNSKWSLMIYGRS